MHPTPHNEPVISSERPAAGLPTAELKVTVLALLLMFYFPFVDRNYLYNYEFDTYVFNKFVRHYLDFFSSFKISALPAPATWPPYFDGHYLIYTLLTSAVNVVAGFSDLVRTTLPTLDSRIHFVGRWVSYLCLVSAGYFVFLSAISITRRISTSLWLAAVFVLTPVMHEIDLSRQDHLVMALLVFGGYCAINILDNRQRTRYLYLLGISSAVLVNTKLSSVAFVSIPALVSVFLVWEGRSQYGRVAKSWLLFLVVSLALAFRYLVHYDVEFSNLLSQLRDLGFWSAYLPQSSLLYYGWAALDFYGTAFRVLYLLGSFYLLVKGLWIKDRLALFVSIHAIVYLGLSLLGVGYSRGGYHLLPFIFLILSLMIHDAMSMATTVVRSPWPLRAVEVIILLFLVQPTWHLAQRYVNKYEELKLRDQSVFINRVLPRSWIATHYERGSRVSGTPWSIIVLPNIENEGYEHERQLLNLAFLNPDSLRDRRPPSLDEIRVAADVLVISDWDEAFILGTFKQPGLEERYQEWLSFFRDLPKHFNRLKFTAQTTVYNVREVSVFPIREPLDYSDDQVSNEDYWSPVTITRRDPSAPVRQEPLLTKTLPNEVQADQGHLTRQFPCSLEVAGAALWYDRGNTNTRDSTHLDALQELFSARHRGSLPCLMAYRTLTERLASAEGRDPYVPLTTTCDAELALAEVYVSKVFDDPLRQATRPVLERARAAQKGRQTELCRIAVGKIRRAYFEAVFGARDSR